MSESRQSGPLRAYTFREAQYYLTVTCCQHCGKGPWLIDDTAVGPAATGGLTLITGRCKNCQAQREFSFVCDYELPRDGAELELINPTDQPSRIVDLGQWLSVFYLLVESAASDDSSVGTRRSGYQAALCLAEALKFYGDDELPPASAFFSETTAAIFRSHPEKFARQKLRDMQSKLPALHLMARRIARDERQSRRPWWRLWR
jgi:hypothetical protein